MQETPQGQNDFVLSLKEMVESQMPKVDHLLSNRYLNFAPQNAYYFSKAKGNINY